MKLYLSIFLTVISLYCYSQQDYERAVIETKTGVIIAFTTDQNGFTVHLDTAEIQPLEIDRANTTFINVDKKWLLQLFTVDFEFPKNKYVADPDVQKSFLIQYMNYETSYFKEELGLQVLNPKVKWGKLNQNYFLLWYFDTPEYETAQKQIYLTTICHDHFLNINIPLEPGIKLNEGIDFLNRVGSSLELFDHRVDVEGIYMRVNEM